MNKYYAGTQIRVDDIVYDVVRVEERRTYSKVHTSTGYTFTLPKSGPSYVWSPIKEIRNVVNSSSDGLYSVTKNGLVRLAQNPVWSAFLECVNNALEEHTAKSSNVTWRWRDDGFAYLQAHIPSENRLFTAVVDSTGDLESFHEYYVS